MNKIIFILGPTGVGKSRLSHQLAAARSTITVNCDSLQIYKDLNIGTAKPSPVELLESPHELFSFVEASTNFTAGDYRRCALEVIEKYHKQKLQLVFVGGSGFYVQALEKGMFNIPDVPESLRNQILKDLEELGKQRLYQKMLILDPGLESKIHPNDVYRISRALGVMTVTGKKMSEISKSFDEQKSNSLKSPSLKIGLKVERSRLKTRVTNRVQKMLEYGLVEEVKKLLSRGLEEWPPMKSIGYKECISFLHGDIGHDQLEQEIVKNTMGLAKRQMTWFKRDQEIRWFDCENEFHQAFDFIQSSISVDVP